MGISFSAEDMQIGVPLTIAIALQDFPEGLAVVLALCTTNISRGKAVAIGVFFRFDGAGRRFIRREFSGRPGICLSAGFGLVGRSHDVCGFP